MANRVQLILFSIAVIFAYCSSLANEAINETDVNRTLNASNATTSKVPTIVNNTEIVDHNVTSSSNEYADANQTDRPLFNVTTLLIPSVDLDSSDDQCTCDFTASQCDVNCCCDPDCSAFNREAFVDCVDVPSRTHAYDPRYCFKEIFIVRNNTSYKFVKTADDFFCIYTDNFKQRFEYKEPTIVASAAHFDDLVKKYSRHPWATTFKARRDDFTRETYKVGSPLYVKYANEQLGYLALPRNVPTGACNGNNPMSFLASQTFTCHQHFTNLHHDCASNVWLNGSTYFKNFEVARTPASFKDEANSTETAGFIDVTPQLCQSSPDHSSALCTPETDIPEPKYNETDGKCYNAVSSVVYVVEHNGTEGLLNVEARLTLKNVDANNWSQTFAVIFEWTSSENVTALFVRSGNPGYRMGSPIIAGKLIKRRDDVKGTKTAVKVSRAKSTWLTVVLPSESGLCIREAGSADRLSVRFGRDMKTGCQVVISLANVTDACQSVQSAAIDALNGWHSPEVVAAYGNPSLDNLGEWIAILRENVPSIGHRSVNTDAGCTNIVRELNVHIVYVNTGHFGNPQPKIVGVRFRYGLAEKVEIRCIGRHCQSGTEELTRPFAVTMSVTFVDASEPAVPIYPVPPSIDVRLPYDFFYPFHGSSTASKNGGVQLLFTIRAATLMCPIILIIFKF